MAQRGTGIAYQVARYGHGFNGPGKRWLGSSLRILARKLRRIEGPYTIDDPTDPDDGATRRDRKQTKARVHDRMVNAPVGTKLIVRGENYDQGGFAIRKVDVMPPHPLVDAAKRYIGNLYELGAIPPPKADCSGLTLKAVSEVYHFMLPHMAYQQAEDRRIRIFHDPADLEPDDFIFYVYGRLGYTIDHVALFVSTGQEIGARPSAGGVHITPIDWDNVECYGRIKAVNGK